MIKIRIYRITLFAEEISAFEREGVSLSEHLNFLFSKATSQFFLCSTPSVINPIAFYNAILLLSSYRSFISIFQYEMEIVACRKIFIRKWTNLKH